MGKKKNDAAVALAKLRMKRMSPEERQEVARKGGEATRENLSANERSAIARKAGLAGGRGRPKAAPAKTTAKRAAPASSAPVRKKPPAAAPAARPKRSPAR